MKKLYCYPAKHPGESYIVPDGVTTIVGDAFSCALILKEIFVPPSVKVITDYFANHVINLEKLVIYNRKEKVNLCQNFNTCFFKVLKPAEEIIMYLPYSLCYCKLSKRCPISHFDYSIYLGIIICS